MRRRQPGSICQMRIGLTLGGFTQRSAGFTNSTVQSLTILVKLVLFTLANELWSPFSKVKDKRWIWLMQGPISLHHFGAYLPKWQRTELYMSVQLGYSTELTEDQNDQGLKCPLRHSDLSVVPSINKGIGWTCSKLSSLSVRILLCDWLVAHI